MGRKVELRGKQCWGRRRLLEMGREEVSRGPRMGERGLPRMRGFPAGPHTWHRASAQIFQVAGDLLRRIMCLSTQAFVMCNSMV